MMHHKGQPRWLYVETGQDNDDIIVPPLSQIKREEFRSHKYPEVRQYNDGDLNEWMEMIHAVRVALGQNDEGKIARPIRSGELIALTKHPHQGKDYRPRRTGQEILNFGYYDGIYGKKENEPFGPIWHKVATFGGRYILAQFEYILPLSHRRFFACGVHVYEIVGGKDVVRRINPQKAVRQIATALDVVWHANNPKPEGLVFDPKMSFIEDDEPNVVAIRNS